jgi:hypothetical protein
MSWRCYTELASLFVTPYLTGALQVLGKKERCPGLLTRVSRVTGSMPVQKTELLLIQVKFTQLKIHAAACIRVP